MAESARANAPVVKRMGRPPGTIARLTKRALEIADQFDKHPLEYLLEVVNDANEPTQSRTGAAQAAMPYLVPKLATLDISAFIQKDDRSPNEITRDLEAMLDRAAVSYRDNPQAFVMARRNLMGGAIDQRIARERPIDGEIVE